MTARWVAMRPEGIGRCRHGHHPVVVFREVGGPSGLSLGIDEGEARLLAGEHNGVRSRHSRTYETLEWVITALGGTVTALQLVGDRRRGISSEIEVAGDGRRMRTRAHPGDVAALAWRLHLDVLVPAELASVPGEENWEWWPDAPCEAMADIEDNLRRVLPDAAPEDYDW